MPVGFNISQEWGNGTSVGAVAGTSKGTVITSNASANVKGAYTQLVAATSADADAAVISLYNSKSTLEQFAVDIAIGGAGSEQIILPNLIIQNPTGTNTTALNTVVIPISIASGTRIAARCADTAGGGNSCNVSLSLFATSFAAYASPSLYDAIGISNETGTSIDPGGTANTKGSYTQVTASTAADYIGFLLMLDTNAVTGSGATMSWLLDLAVGAGGSEQIILPNLPVGHATSDPYVNPMSLYLPIPIAAGARIAARAQCTTNSASPRLLSVSLLGAR